MRIIEQAVKQPISVIVGVIMSLIAGVLVYNQVPVQMTPTVDSVVVSVRTFWENASPQEIESEKGFSDAHARHMGEPMSNYSIALAKKTTPAHPSRVSRTRVAPVFEVL